MSRKPWPLVLGIAATLLAAGCGGGAKPEATRLVRAARFSFRAPQSWQIDRSVRGVTLTRKRGAPELLSVTVFPLARPFRPALWREAVAELDRAAAGVAAQVHGKVEARATVTVAGARARRYDLGFARNGEKLGERIVFVLRRRREYQLLCRWHAPVRGDVEAACDMLSASFRPAR